jgi:hypothetical protein
MHTCSHTCTQMPIQAVRPHTPAHCPQQDPPQVGAVEAVAEGPAVRRQAQLHLDILLHPGRGCGGEGQHRHIREPLLEHRQLLVVWPEVMAPLDRHRGTEAARYIPWLWHHGAELTGWSLERCRCKLQLRPTWAPALRQHTSGCGWACWTGVKHTEFGMSFAGRCEIVCM